MILPALYEAIEFALNHSISLDPEGKKLIHKFNTKIIKLDISSPDLSIYILAQGSHFQILETYAGAVDTTIKARLIDLAKLSLQNMSLHNIGSQNLSKNNQASTQAVFSGKIKIEGNIALGQQFQSLFKQLDIDWEEHLSHITGDIIAHQLFNSGKKLLSWGYKSQQSLSLDLADFLQYESRDLLEKREVELFLTAVDELKNDYDRLEAKVTRLQNKL